MTTLTVFPPAGHDKQAYHIESDSFDQKDAGLTPPQRQLGSLNPQGCLVAPTGADQGTQNAIQFVAEGLKVLAPRRDEPPGYGRKKSYIRSDDYPNIFRLTPAPAMPSIRVSCETRGFNASQSTPLFWRLQCRTIIGRFKRDDNVPYYDVLKDGKEYTGKPYKYIGECVALDLEWQGKAFAPSFELFNPKDTNVQYDYNSLQGPISGGNAILTVAAQPNGVKLQDYVHLRIVGDAVHSRKGPQEKPDPPQDVLDFVDGLVADRDPNLGSMIKAVLWKETSMAQFAESHQTGFHRTFHHAQHINPDQEDCKVSFDIPNDPPGFPNVAYDFGVGMSQWTLLRKRVLTTAKAWDWQDNILESTNQILLKALGEAYDKTYTWRRWASFGYAGYNGAGSYADAVENNQFGKLVSKDNVPGEEEKDNLVSPLKPPTALAGRRAKLGDPPKWPPGSG